MSIILSPDQEYAFQKFKERKNLFITGPGGTGKSVLIRHLYQHATDMGKHVNVCALTGCAAVLLNCNAKTIHSWSGIKLAKGEKEGIIQGVLRNKRSLDKWRKVDILIVDEVSMMSVKIFEILEEIGRRVKKPVLPFGGIQVVFTGDFYQLPPVGNESERDTCDFCFKSVFWNRVFPWENHISLTTMYRQKDPEYIRILQQVRTGSIDESGSALLSSHVNRKCGDSCPPKLYALKNRADYINSSMYAKLDSDEQSFDCIVKTDVDTYKEGKSIPVAIKSQCSRMTGEQKQYEIDNLINVWSIPKVLKLKVGSNVMCKFNTTYGENTFYNGLQGTIIEFRANGLPVVKFENGMTSAVPYYECQSEEYPCISVSQIPLMLCWAMTIHKIQGATLSCAEMDLGSTVFEYGQSYVALSRIQKLEGLYLTSFNPTKIKANPCIHEFYEKIPSVPLTE